MSIFSKLSFKDQAFKLRENAILDATTAILGTKGYDLMTMDDVANAVGISKPSLYKHFKSKRGFSWRGFNSFDRWGDRFFSAIK
ncbi:helix-turn-helix domain-containing protein [Deefgea sp. CFH1-16]|uniref:TetR/AcrR family transcriptional regulator n=1 Tax=Deefgea sp. CFH1-16 TaxID=2675457 RepID=UPI0027DAB6A8|nr:helix-turn-helix domain-containing protein [Deefgea sp. CFH1-16]